jgi:hypothetical protein
VDAAGGLRFGVLGGGGGLFVGFGEGAAEDARAGYEDLGYYAVRLGGRVSMYITRYLCEGGGDVD